jgi:hypothetical protein
MRFGYARWLLRLYSLVFIGLTVYRNALCLIKEHEEHLFSRLQFAGLALVAGFLPIVMVVFLFFVKFQDPGPSAQGSPLYLAVRPDFIKLVSIGAASVLLSFVAC